jgi:hypothetical protein
MKKNWSPLVARLVGFFLPGFRFVQSSYWYRGRSKLPNYTSLDWWDTIYIHVVMNTKKHHAEFQLM